MRRDTHGGGSRGDCGPFDSPHGGACPTTPQTASRMTAAHAAPPWPIKTQLSGVDTIPTQVDWVWLCVCVCWGCSCAPAIISWWIDPLSTASSTFVCVCVHSCVIRCTRGTHAHACFKNICPSPGCAECQCLCVCVKLVCKSWLWIEVLSRQAVLGYMQTDL